MTGDLLQRLQAGEPAAGTELFELCQTRLRPFIQPRLPNAADADIDDCVSEVVTRALEGIRKGQRPEVLNAWLVGIAKNLLKERYRAKDRAADDLSDDLPQPAGDVQLELERTDLPELPSDLEIVLGKRQLWATLGAATRGLSGGLAAIMHTHIELTLRRKRPVVGAELAAELGQPVDIVNRQLQRSRTRMLDAIAALVLARTGRASCPELATALDTILRPGQQLAGRRLVLDPAQTSAVLKHSNGCATCAPRADEARDYSRWLLGPGLIRLAEDDEERRRAILALLDRAGDARQVMQSPAAAALTAVPAPLAGSGVITSTEPAGLAERLRSIALKTPVLRRMDGVARFAQENPDAFTRMLAATAGGVVAAAAITAALLAPDPPALHTASPPGTFPTTSATPTAAAPPDISTPVAPAAATSPATAALSHTPTPTNPTTPPPASTASSRPATGAPPPQRSPESARSTQPSTTPPPAPPPQSPPADPAPPTTSSPQPPPAAESIDVDLTDLDYTAFTVSGVAGQLDARHAQSLKLTPGSHTLITSAGHRLTFQTTSDNRVTYDPSLEGTFTGGGTSALVVHGHAVTFDVTDLDYANTTVNGTGWQAAQPVRTRKLLPGKHSLYTSNGNSVPFTVTDAGRVTYDRALEGELTGYDTIRLAVHGFPVTLDVTDLDYYSTTISGTGWPAPQAVRTRKLLPGVHSVTPMAGSAVPFTVTATGHVEYQPGLQGLLTGTGGTTLAVHGLRVTLDTTDLSYANTSMSGVGWPTPQPVRVLRLLPGVHYVVTNGGRTVPFSVTSDGRMQYAPALEGQLTGAGSTTLSVHGFPIQLDVTDVDYANVTVNGVAPGTPRPPRTLKLLPGNHYIVTNSGLTVPFSVSGTGKVQYAPGLEGLFTGAGGTTLAVRGFAITLDATGSGYAQFGVGGVGWWNSGQTRTVRLLPGSHYVTVPGGGRLFFQVSATGKGDYASEMDAVLSGRGGTTLTIRAPHG